MINRQCPCAELFKIGDDYTREHHELCAADSLTFVCDDPNNERPVRYYPHQPDCGIAQAEKFGQLVEQGKEYLRGKIYHVCQMPTRPLTDEEIEALKAAGEGLTYPFDEESK